MIWGYHCFWKHTYITDITEYLYREYKLRFRVFLTGWRCVHLGGNSNIFFYFHPDTWGNDPIWEACFSKGLKPPTSYTIHTYLEPPNNQFKMDVWWCSTIFYVMIWNHPVETTSKKTGLFPARTFINWPRKKPLTFHYTDCLDPETMVYYNPHIVG